MRQMRHPNTRWQKLCFLVRNQKKSKMGYLKNILSLHKLNFKKMIDSEWDSYIAYLKDKNQKDLK